MTTIILQWVFIAALITFASLVIPYAISSESRIAALWRYLKENHQKKWLELGAPDTLTELMTTRGFGSLEKKLSKLDDIPDAELQSQVKKLREMERYAGYVLLPIFMIMLFSGLAMSVMSDMKP